MMLFGGFFFFSSRRGHTRLQGDWECRRVLFRSVILPAGIVVGITAAFEFARRGDEDQFFGIVDEKGGEDNLVQQGEDGGIGADAEAQRKDHDQAEHGRLGQGSKGIADARHYDDYDVEWRRYDRRAALGRLWQAEAP